MYGYITEVTQLGISCNMWFNGSTQTLIRRLDLISIGVWRQRILSNIIVIDINPFKLELATVGGTFESEDRLKATISKLERIS
jgi:hypothetical protein